jgi:acetyl/propionyl-CoA carboxylase alpha subunit
MGSKIGAKKFLSSGKLAGKIPTIPGYHGDDQSTSTLIQEALKIGFPVLLKASAGGGGKGIEQLSKSKQFSFSSRFEIDSDNITP